MRGSFAHEISEEKARQLANQVSHILEHNKNSLKVLLGVWRELFELMLSGLRLDEFVIEQCTRSEDIKVGKCLSFLDMTNV